MPQTSKLVSNSFMAFRKDWPSWANFGQRPDFKPIIHNLYI